MNTDRSIRRALVLVAVLIAGSSVTAFAGTSPAEDPLHGPASPRGPLPTDDMLPANHAAQPQARASAPRNATVTPFLTRPYWHTHVVTSIFDHCNPD